MTFFNIILSYPSVIYTTLLGAVVVYWLIALIGLVDFDSGPNLDVDANIDVDVDVDADVDLDAGDTHHHIDGEAHETSVLANILVALGLWGVPFSIVVSLLTLFGWVACSLATTWIMPLVPTTILRIVVGAAVIVGAFVLSILATEICVPLLRRLFVSHDAISNASLVGQECIVLTGTVDEKFGRAEVPDQGAGYHIRVVADTPNSLKRGDRATILGYDAAQRIYRIK